VSRVNETKSKEPSSLNMSDIISNVKKNKLSIIFCCAILIYLLLLYINTFTFNASARVYPQMFIFLTSVPAILKIILSMTDLPLLKALDSLTSENTEETTTEEVSTIEEKDNKAELYREYFAIFSYIAFFISIYLFGFTVGVFIFVFYFSFSNFKSWRRSFVVTLSLTLLTYLASELLMTQTWYGFLFQIF